jgi:hypothetical protein
LAIDKGCLYQTASSDRRVKFYEEMVKYDTPVAERLGLGLTIRARAKQQEIPGLNNSDGRG